MTLSKEMQIRIFERDGKTCRGCGLVLPTKYEVSHPAKENYLVVDHIEGKSNDSSNLQTLCQKCNAGKAGKGAAAFELYSALKTLGQCVAYYPSLARVMGIKESIFLCQLIYWTPKGRHEKGDGWIYKSVEEMNEETGLSYKEQSRVRKALITQGMLEEMHDRNEHRIYFRVLASGIDKKGKQLTKGQMPKGKEASDHRADGSLPTGSSYKEHKTTQETTQENTSSDDMTLFGESLSKSITKVVKEELAEHVEKILNEYPKRAKGFPKAPARAAIEKALKRIVAGEITGSVMLLPTAIDLLLRKTMLFAVLRKGEDSTFTPHAATFYNQKHYLDVDSAEVADRVSTNETQSVTANARDAVRSQMKGGKR